MSGSLTKSRILVAMSGGVDSSVTAALLHEQGHQVIGAMMRFWPDEKRTATFDTCCSPDAAYEARRVADQIGIPFYLLDYQDEFKEHIVEPFIEEYKSGRTPNPCVNCNTKVKFDALIRKAKMLGCDYVATGHYVRRAGDSGEVALERGSDAKKDQTYFLWGTPRDALRHMLFPVGHLEKPQVRALAERFGLITAQKPESQNICFVPGSVQAYLSEYIPEVSGPMVDVQTGEKVGEHLGTQFYTIGQKKGLGLYKSNETRYVVQIDAQKNIVWVGTFEDCHWSKVKASRANFLLDWQNIPTDIEVQIRYRTPAIPAQLTHIGPTDFEVTFSEPQFAVAPGQSVVIYSGDRLLGGGIIEAEKHNFPTPNIKKFSLRE